MDVLEYENAINAMSIDIRIDHIVFNHGHTKEVYGHSEKLYLKWNMRGKCFAYEDGERLPMEPLETKEKVPSICWVRHEELDIKSKLWHDPDEEPEHHRYVLVEYNIKGFSDNAWEATIPNGKIEGGEISNIIRWAYMDDILEKTED